MSGFPSLAGAITSSLGEGSVIEKPFTARKLRRSVTKFLAKHNRRSHGNGDSARGMKGRLVDKIPLTMRKLIVH